MKTSLHTKDVELEELRREKASSIDNQVMKNNNQINALTLSTQNAELYQRNYSEL